MTDQPILKMTSSSFEAARARAAAAAIKPPAFEGELLKAMRGMTTRSEEMMRQVANSDPFREIRKTLVHDWRADFGMNVRKLSEDAVGETFRRQMKSLMESIGGMGRPDDVRASFLKTATGLDTEQLMGGWTSQSFLRELAGQSVHKQFAEQASRWSTSHEDLLRSLSQFREPLDWSSARQILDMFVRAPSVAGLSEKLEEGQGSSDDQAKRETEDAAVHELTASVEAQPTLQDALNQILAAIDRNQQPRLQLYLVGVLLPILLMAFNLVLAPVADFHLKQALEATKPENKKGVQVVARQAVSDVRLLKELRFVGAKRLQVMASARARGAVVGQLRFGQVVRVVEKERDFTLIVWKSEDGKAELQGWVFSRYLERFK
ncbi:SH3 domain-containing protein [Roseateles sp. L2-2]|uniref:SH3 domain-containing protein n=1 Tax=Roseateles sp. L2-2 TaxID=3422597 RepID=UPI003D36B5D2